MEKETIDIDTNIIWGLGKQILNEYKKNKHKPLLNVISDVLENKTSGILINLFKNFNLVTSVLSKYEFIKTLKTEESVLILREIYNEIISHFKIISITFKEFENFLTYKFFEDLLKYDIDLADGIQILVASKKKLPFVTGDKRDIPKMKKLYSEIFSVKEIYEKLKSKK